MNIRLSVAFLAILGLGGHCPAGEKPSLRATWDLPVHCDPFAAPRLQDLREELRQTGYRLPTEAEWECACRAGTRTKYFFGDDPARLGTYACFKGNTTGGPAVVGTKQPNAWGLYDMGGNVWEWCHDFYKDDYYRSGPPFDPRGPQARPPRVLRGGCWNSRADLCRSGYRMDETPVFTDTCFGRDISGFVGFRCVRSQRATQ